MIHTISTQSSLQDLAMPSQSLIWSRTCAPTPALVSSCDPKHVMYASPRGIAYGQAGT